MRILLLLLLILLPTGAYAQGSVSRCTVDPHYFGCLNPATALTRNNVVPLAQGDDPRSASVAAILSRMIASDVTAALGFTPYNAANPAGYIAASGAPVQSVAGRTGAVVLAAADVSGVAPLASPALTGTPTAPTAASGTATTQLATTAFVANQVASRAPMNTPSFTGSVAVAGAGAAIELGGRGAANTPYLDFHSGATDTDYDARIIGSGGNGATGQGGLTFFGSSMIFNAPVSINAGVAVAGALTTGGLNSGGVNINLATTGTTAATAAQISLNSVFLIDGSGSGAVLPPFASMVNGKATWIEVFNYSSNSKTIYTATGSILTIMSPSASISMPSGSHARFWWPGAGTAWVFVQS